MIINDNSSEACKTLYSYTIASSITFPPHSLAETASDSQPVSAQLGQSQKGLIRCEADRLFSRIAFSSPTNHCCNGPTVCTPFTINERTLSTARICLQSFFFFSFWCSVSLKPFTRSFSTFEKSLSVDIIFVCDIGARFYPKGHHLQSPARG